MLAVAEELGYNPDPMLSALAAYRMRSKPAAFHGNLGWVVNHQGSEFRWRDTPIYREYFEGAKRRASQSGYLLDVFDLGFRGVTPRRLAAMLRARNVQGILLCPQRGPDARIDFPWEHFSAVTLGHSLREPRLHMVAATQYRNAVNTVRRVRELGYLKIGYVVGADYDRRSDRNYLAGYLAETYAPDAGAIPPLAADYYDEPETLRAWYGRFRPDAIVTFDPGLIRPLRGMGLKVPQDVGVACFALPDTTGPMAGMHENTPHIGAVTVDFLVGMLHRGERGIPEIQQRLMVEGTWMVGESVREHIGTI